jgi:hypothetical protein
MDSSPGTLEKEAGWLGQNRSGNEEERTGFFTPTARNPLKRLDSKK